MLQLVEGGGSIFAIRYTQRDNIVVTPSRINNISDQFPSHRNTSFSRLNTSVPAYTSGRSGSSGAFSLGGYGLLSWAPKPGRGGSWGLPRY